MRLFITKQKMKNPATGLREDVPLVVNPMMVTYLEMKNPEETYIYFPDGTYVVSSQEIADVILGLECAMELSGLPISLRKKGKK